MPTIGVRAIAFELGRGAATVEDVLHREEVLTSFRSVGYRLDINPFNGPNFERFIVKVFHFEQATIVILSGDMLKQHFAMGDLVGPFYSEMIYKNVLTY